MVLFLLGFVAVLVDCIFVKSFSCLNFLHLFVSFSSRFGNPVYIFSFIVVSKFIPNSTAGFIEGVFQNFHVLLLFADNKFLFIVCHSVFV